MRSSNVCLFVMTRADIQVYIQALLIIFVYNLCILSKGWHANLFFSTQDENPQIFRLIPLTRIRFLGPPVRNFKIHNFLLLIHKSQIRKFHRCASPLIANPQKLGSANRKKDWVRKSQKYKVCKAKV